MTMKQWGRLWLTPSHLIRRSRRNKPDGALCNLPGRWWYAWVVFSSSFLQIIRPEGRKMNIATQRAEFSGLPSCFVPLGYVCLSVMFNRLPKKFLLTQKICIAKSEGIYIWPNYLSVVVTLPFIGTKGLNYIPHLALLPSSKRQRNCDGTCSKNNHRWATYSLTPMRTKVLNRYRQKLNICSSSWLLLYHNFVTQSV